MMKKADFQFQFEGVTGYVFGDFVTWGGCHFQLEAARAELRKAIEEGRKNKNTCAARGGCFGGDCCLK